MGLSLIKSIKDQVSIVDVAERFLDVQKRGRSFKALCPFHSEKSASFNLMPEKGRYRCYGCGESGDVIDLYSALSKTDRKDALKELADLYDVKSGELSEGFKKREIEAHVSKKRQDLRLYMLGAAKAIEDITRSIDSLEAMNFYGDLYHVLSKVDMWLHNVEVCSASELRDMQEEVTSYLNGIYKRYIERGNQIEQSC